MKKLKIILAFSLIMVQIGQSQDLPSLGITARYDSTQNIMMLRWAPESAKLWFAANKYGYSVVKYYYQKDGELLTPPLKKEILANKVRPKPLDEWEELVNRSDYAAIAAQSVYGESIGVTNAQEDIFSIVNKSKEDQSRFSFSLFAADQSLEVADFLGLYVEDHKVSKNERYLYRIYVNVPDSIMQADTAAIYYGPEDYSSLPAPKVESVVQKDDFVVLKWLNGPYLNIFSSYSIQRSFTGKDFDNINSLPTINFESGPTKSNLFNSFIDTTRYEGKAFYRILGKNVFGQLSIPSDTFSIVKMKSYEVPIPKIDSVEFNENNSNAIYWSANGASEFIDKAFLEKSYKSEGRYELVELDSLFKNSYLSDTSPNEINYYRVGITAGENVKYSMPFLFQNIDSIPPAIPAFFNYEVEDSVVKLSWYANTDEDIAGYRIYKSIKRNAEPSLIYSEQSLDTTVILKENLSFINNERYYYLVAFDKNGNASALSKRFKVKLPDIVPPTPPQIRNVTQQGDTLTIDFVKSSSSDIESYLLYRKLEDDLYKLVKQINPSQNQLTDIVEKGGKNFYRLVAIDSSGNEGVSKPYSFYVKIKSEEEFKYEIFEGEDYVSVLWEKNSNYEAQKVKVYYKINDTYNLIKEASIREGELLIERKNIKKEQLKIICI
ncbi:hypothetical protein [Marivirga sp.]|uniref:fibronectin type III domain-containing protein n=1 Tax=Marivirga sp. TaxID=2018662 RepID=UPI002D7EC2A0|nr:hypothetical protein [Marivirga sp.]HET8858817.1 hypothetical protein [Marivirga sp.]